MPEQKSSKWPSLTELCESRGISASQFLQDNDITLSDPFSKHVAWAYRHIYQIPYPKEGPYAERKFYPYRRIHGIQHVARAAFYVPILVNLYRRYHDPEALALTPEDIHLIQIAVLFHDAARLNEGEDKWDRDSAAFLYHYLTDVLKVNPEKANLLAKAVAEKDSKEPKNIYQKIISGVDGLDIIRARAHYDATYLDFYQDIAKNNSQAFQEMAQLILEIRSGVEVQGDSFNRINDKLKLDIECAEAYKKIQDTFIKEKKESKKDDDFSNTIDPRDHYKMIPLFYQILDRPDEVKIPFPKECKSDVLNEETVDQLLFNGKIYFRGVTNPSALRKKDDESMGHLEVRKMRRRPRVATRSKKPDKINKDGNPLRSISQIGNGGVTFSDCGFLIVNPSLDNIHKVRPHDCGSGHYKKTLSKDSIFSREEKEKQLQALSIQLKMGGKSVRFSNNIFSCHNEILCRIRDDESVQAIAYSKDPNLYNIDIYDDPYPRHPNAPARQSH